MYQKIKKKSILIGYLDAQDLNLKIHADGPELLGQVVNQLPARAAADVDGRQLLEPIL
jgi:hypothetical protein